MRGVGNYDTRGVSAAHMEVWCEKTIEEAPLSSVKTAAEHLLVAYRERGRKLEQLQSRVAAMTEWLEKNEPSVWRRGLWDHIFKATDIAKPGSNV